MQTRHNGILTIHNGRRTVDGITIEAAAEVRNDAEIYTHTAISEGSITGTGTLWAHITSKPIGGVIGAMQVIIYYPVDKSFVLPIVIGALVSENNLRLPEGSLT
jgi:hypothetical protein